ncbi:MAG: hypothetical protein KME12_25840 [Trichocoleus desertorum ATA4-8-CV12]|nr:hypothetical protein [Trichocoleus desertorum ATA4-8-CV12]
MSVKQRRFLWHGFFLFFVGCIIPLFIPLYSNPRAGLAAHTIGLTLGLFASAVYCLPDILAGLQELQRVTKPGGRVAFSSRGEIGDHSVTGVYTACLREYGVALPPVMPLQRVDTLDKCRQLLQDVGLENIEVYSEELGYYAQSPDECWDFIWNTGNRMHLSQLEPEKVEPFRVEYLKKVATLATNQGI